MQLKMRINKIISSAQVIGVFDINDEAKVRFVIEGAGPTNTIQIRARILGQPTFYDLEVLTGNVNQVVNVSTYEELQLECTNFDAVSDSIKLYAASFNEAGGSAIDSIGVPSGDDITNFTEFNFESSDSTISISGDNLTKTIDLTAVTSNLSYTPSDSSDWSPVPTLLTEAVDQLADRTSESETDIVVLYGTKIDISEKGAANGVAPLNSASQIDSIYLPSFVDDVVEYADFSSFPPVGETSKIYVALDTNLTYRWSGSTYVEISESKVLSVNSQVGVVVLDKADIGLDQIDNTSDLDKPISNDTQDALDLKVNKSGDTMTGAISMQYFGNTTNVSLFGIDTTGNLTLRSNDNTLTHSGDIVVETGDVTGSDYAGSIYLNGGANVDGSPSNIVLTAGQSLGTGVNGSIILNSKQVVYLNQNPAGYVDAVNHHIQNVLDPISPQDAATKKWVEDVSSLTNILFVDSSASLFGADGSLLKPFVTIASAISAASDGSVILIFPGTYSESQVLIPSSLSFLTIKGASQGSVTVTNGFSYTAPAGSIDLLLEQLNVGQLSIDAGSALNGLVTLKQTSVNINRTDSNANVFLTISESTIFGSICYGAANVSECLIISNIDIYSPVFIFENCKFVSSVTAYGTAVVRVLDSNLFGASEFVHGSIVSGNTPTIQIDTASDSLGGLSGVYTKVLLANIPLSNITQSLANTNQFPKWNGSAWEASDLEASITSYTPADAGDWTVVPTLVDAGLDELASRMITMESGGSSTSAVFQDTNEPTGFINRTDSTISFDDITRTFTIAPALTQFSFYLKGTKYTKTTAENLTITTDTGNHYIYYDATGSLASTTVFSPSIIEQYAFIAVVYWNNDISEHVYFAEERHGITMDGITHAYFHTVFGARYLSGLALQGFSIDGSGNLEAHAQFTADGGSLRDEDILHVLSSQSQIPILYRSGLAWRKKPADAYPIIYSGTEGYVGVDGRLPYNQFTAGNWQLTEVANSEYVLVHFFGTNDIDNPIVGIQGVSAYNSIASARLGANEEIASLSGLPFAEFVAVGSVIFQSATGYGNIPKAKVISTDIGTSYVDFRGTQLYTPAGEATTHGLLSGLLNDDHPQYHTDARGDIRYYTKSQIDLDVIKKAGTTAFTGNQSMGGYKLTNVANPVDLTDAVNLQTLNAALGASGDILETSFALLDNQITSIDITGFIFPNATVRSFQAQASISISATSSLYEKVEINGIQKSSGWEISISSEGDSSEVGLTITSAGQLQYTTPNYAGFSSGVIKFRAITTSV